MMSQGKAKPMSSDELREHYTFMCTETSYREAFRIAAFGNDNGEGTLRDVGCVGRRPAVPTVTTGSVYDGRARGEDPEPQV